MSAFTCRVVLMGVSGSGKTSVGRALALALGWPFCEGDDLHPRANVARMRAGMPLDDADRAPWLDRVAGWIGEHAARNEGGVVSCSALKRVYRDRLRRADASLRFVLLDPAPSVLAERLAGRAEHFMPPALLASQLATLERPGADEHALVLDEHHDGAAACAATLAWLRTAPPPAA